MTAVALVPAGRTLGVIGAGVMGQTLMKGLIDAGLIRREQVWAVERTAATREEVAEKVGIVVAADYAGHLDTASIVLLCVKPSQAATALATVRAANPRPDTLFVSILAGVTTAQLEAGLGLANPWVRAMPNTPSVVGS